ncbi:MAG: helix-turn-helix domain-containing protein, partial [Comamonadaceae bacterium]
MPSAAPALSNSAAEQLAALGEQLRLTRKKQKVSAVAAAEAAGISRVTLHRIERGEPSTTAGAWAAVAAALGLRLGIEPSQAQSEPPALLPERIALADYPQLQQLAWQLKGIDTLSPQEALNLYERNWRHVDRQALTMREIALINA